MRITLRQLLAFVTVADLGHFSKAAAALATSQPALSQSVRDLEGELGVRLFDRTTRRVELTAAGRDFAQSTRQALTLVEGAMDRMRDLARLRRGSVTIAAPPLLAATLMPRLMARAAEIHPGLALNLDDVTTDLIVEKVRIGAADIGVGTFNTDLDGLRQLPLFRDRLMAVMIAGCSLSSLREVPWSMLGDHPVISLSRESSLRLLTEVGFERAGVAFRPHITVRQIHTALALVAAGQGVAVLPAHATDGTSLSDITARPLVDPPMQREVSIIHPDDRSLAPAASAVVELLVQLARD
ncbi:MAG: LysR family transcriptional regulator [Geminicoccaceae bacterium]|nr:LysR family transcriptional regulator [Geminicoccaceae bacterium]MCB9945660.1 LysR family transcriptional regulator [Geminicoccaceae bacterium]